MLWTIFVILLVLWAAGSCDELHDGRLDPRASRHRRGRARHPADPGAARRLTHPTETPASDGRSEQRPDARGHRHRERAPERDAYRAHPARRRRRRARRAPPSSARNTSEVPDTSGNERRAGATTATSSGMRRADREARRRGERRLDRTRAERLGDAELVARVRAERVVGHELVGDLPGERGIEAARDVDRRQLAGARPRRRPRAPRARASRSALSVSACERTDTYSPAAIDMAPGDQAGDAGDQHAAVRRVRGGDAEHEARRGHDAVVGAEHRGAQPADAVRAMPLLARARGRFAQPASSFAQDLNLEAAAPAGPNPARRGSEERTS